MVQFKPALENVLVLQYRSDEYRTHSWWKLGFDLIRTIGHAREFLAERGYRCPEKASKKQIMDAVGRCQRGLLCYEKCDVDELREFCQGRGIKTKSSTVAGLARLLKKADDAITFPKFLSLPPEIRDIVYEHHFLDAGRCQQGLYDYRASSRDQLQAWSKARGLTNVVETSSWYGRLLERADGDDILTRHYQPPLTTASKLLRAEALPVFYKSATFAWEIEDLDTFIRNSPRVKQDCMKYMPAKYISQIKNFNLRWTFRVKPEDEFATVNVAVRLNLHDGTEEATHAGVHAERFDYALMGCLRRTFEWESAWKWQNRGDEILEISVEGTVFNEMGTGEDGKPRCGMLMLMVKQ